MKRLLASLIFALLFCGHASAGCMTLLYAGKCSASGPPPLVTPTILPLPSAAFTQSNTAGGGVNTGLAPNGGTVGAFELPATLANSFAFYHEFLADPSGFGTSWMFGFGASNVSSTVPKGIVFLTQNNTSAALVTQITATGSGNATFDWWQPTIGMLGAPTTAAGQADYNSGYYAWTASDGCPSTGGLGLGNGAGAREPGGIILNVAATGGNSATVAPGDPGFLCGENSSGQAPQVNFAAIPGIGAPQLPSATTCASNTPATGQIQVTVTTPIAHGVQPGQSFTLASYTTTAINGTYLALGGTTGTTLIGTNASTGTCPGSITIGGSATVGNGNGTGSITIAAPSVVNPYGTRAFTGITVAPGQRVCGVVGEFGADSGFPGSQFAKYTTISGTDLPGSPAVSPWLNQGATNFTGWTSSTAQTAGSPALTVTAMNSYGISSASFTSTNGFAHFTMSTNPGFIVGSEFIVSGVTTTGGGSFNLTYVAVAGTSGTTIVGNPLSGPIGIPQASSLTNSSTGSSGSMVGVIMPGMYVAGATGYSIINPFGTFGSTGQGGTGTYGLTATQATFSATASFATSVMTVTGTPTSQIVVGDLVVGAGVPANTFVASLGTGVGGAGTYNLTTTPGTIVSQTNTIGPIGTSGSPVRMYAAAPFYGNIAPSGSAAGGGTWTAHTTNFDFMSWIGTFDGTSGLPGHLASSNGDAFVGNLSNVVMFEVAGFPMSSGVPDPTAFGQLCGKTAGFDFQTWASTYGGTWRSHYPLSDGGIYGDDSIADFNGTISGTALTVNSTQFGSLPTVTAGSPVVVVSGAGVAGCPSACPTITSGTSPTYTLNTSGGSVTGPMMAGSWKPAKPLGTTGFNGQIASSTLTVNSLNTASSGTAHTSGTTLTLDSAWSTLLQPGMCIFDGGVNISPNYPICLSSGSGNVIGSTWTFTNAGNLFPAISSENMWATSASIIPGMWVMDGGTNITTPVQVIGYGTNTPCTTTGFTGCGTYPLSNSSNGTVAAEAMTMSGITSGGAIAPGAALTVDNTTLGTIFPVTVGSSTGVMQFAGAYNAGLLGGTPTAIQAQVSSTPQGTPVSGCTPCAWTNLSSSTISGGAWSGTIVGVPEGGPYWVSFRAANGTAYATLPNAVFEGFNLAFFGEGNDAGLITAGPNQTNFTGFGSISGFNTSGTGSTNTTNGAFVPGPSLNNVIPSFAPGFLLDRFGAFGGFSGLDAWASAIQNGNSTSGGAPIGIVNMLKNGTGEANYFYGNITQTQSIGIGDGSSKVFSSGAGYGGNSGASNVATVSSETVGTTAISATTGIGTINAPTTWSYLKPGTQFSCVATGCSTGPFIITAQAGPWVPSLTGLGGTGLYQVSPLPSLAIPNGTALTITHNALDFNGAYNSGATVTGSTSGAVLTITGISLGAVAPGLILTDASTLGPVTVTGCLTGCGPLPSATSTWSLASSVATLGPETMFLNPTGGPLAPLSTQGPLGGAGNIQIPVLTNGGTNGGGAPVIQVGTFEVLVNGSVVCTDSTTFSYNVVAGNCTGTGVTGWVNYFTGAYSITFTTAPANNAPIVAQYTNLMSGNITEAYEQLDWFGNGTRTGGILSAVSANTGGIVGAVTGNNAAGGPWPVNHVAFAKENDYIFGTRWKNLHNGIAGAYLPLGNTRGEGAQAFYGTVDTAPGGEQLGEAYFEAATQDSEFSGTVGTLGGATGAWTAVLTLTTGVTATLPDFPMWEGEALECNPYSQSCALPVNTELANLCTVALCGSASPQPWGVSGSTYALVNLTASSSNVFSVISSAIPMHNALYYTGGVAAYVGPTNDLSMLNSGPTNGYAVEGGTNGIAGPLRLGQRVGLIAGAALSGNPHNAMTPTLSRALPGSGCDSSATYAPCFDIGNTFAASASGTISGSTITFTGGLSAGARPFVPGMNLSCTSCTANRVVLSVSAPPTQSTVSGAGQIGNTFTITASGTMGVSTTETVTGGCKGTSGTGSNCIDFNFDINTTGTYGTTAALNTCGVNNLVGTNTNTLTSGSFLYPNGKCVPTGTGAFVRGFRIGTNQLMDVPFDTIQGSGYDTGADPGPGIGFTSQSAAFTCNLVGSPATVTQCVIAPTYVNGQFSAIGQWASGSTFASYGDPFATTGYLSGIVGSVGGQNVPVTAGSSYPTSSSWITGGVCTLLTGGFGPQAPAMSFGVNSSGQIAGAYPEAIGNGIEASPCTFPISFTFTGVITGWSSLTNQATLAVTGITTQGTIVSGETISDGGAHIPAGSTIVNATGSGLNGSYKISCSSNCNATSETMTSGPTTGSGGAITSATTGVVDGAYGIQWNDNDTNAMGDFLYDNSCVTGNPNAGACLSPSGNLTVPGLATRPFGTRRGVAVSG